MKKLPLLNFNISLGKYPDFLNKILIHAKNKKSSIVCVANVHMFIEAYKKQEFEDIINKAEIVTPDGRPLIWALKLLYGVRQDRVAGMDLLPDLLEIMEKQNISAYFYGGTEKMLSETENFLKSSYPLLKLAGLHSPPFNALNNPASEHVINKINDSLPCVVFVVLGCPKQEKWMDSMKGKVNTVMIGIGGALPVMVGLQKRAP